MAVTKKKAPRGRGDERRRADNLDELADLKRRLGRVEAELAALRRASAEAEAAGDADDVAAHAAAMAEGPGRPYEEVRRELGLA